MSYIKIEGKFEKGTSLADSYVCTIISFFNSVWLTKTTIRYEENYMLSGVMPETSYQFISLKFKRASRTEIFRESIKEANAKRI